MDATGVYGSSQQEEGEEMININLKVNKTVYLNVKRTATIRNVKSLLYMNEGISESLQEFLFDGDHLNDAQNLIDCGIQKDSTIQVHVYDGLPLNMSITMPSNKKTIRIKANPSDTIRNIKIQIAEKERIISDHYTLIYAGKQLDDDWTLARLNIQGDSTLYMLQNPEDKLLISVRMPTGEILRPEVKLLYTIRDVKAILESICGSAVSDLGLTYSGEQLKDSKTLHSYNIKCHSILEMSPRPFPIFIKNLRGKTLTLVVNQHDLVKNVKRRIFPNHSVHFQLVYAGKRLEDDRDLGSYNIQRDCTLHLKI